ncbi:hypothetical protein L9F63_021360, partial [Diploptera punctata]
FPHLQNPKLITRIFTMKKFIPYKKLNIPRKVGQINDRDKFDTGFFGIHPNVTNSTDILIRLMLERAFEAIIDAGLNPDTLKGKNVPVFSGSGIGESEHILCYVHNMYTYGMLGHSRTMLSNRISHWLDVHGTSINFVGSETCGLEALTAAYNELKEGRCDTAIVGVSHCVSTPEICNQYSELGLLSKNWTFKPFDAEADGFLLSDGIVVLILQKAQNAKRIYATIVNSDITYFGDRNGPFRTQSSEYFIELLEKFYDKCGVDPNEIAYLEAEGYGIKEVDEEEMKAVDKILLKNRKTPLLIGCVKSNMGHSLSASAFCAIIKVLIAMQEGVIPPNINFNKPSQSIPALIENRAKIVTEITQWNGGLVALNSFGLFGHFGHILLKSYNKDKSTVYQDDELPYIILASSRTEVGMKEIIVKIASMPVDKEFIALIHDIHSSNIYNHMYRGFTVVPKIDIPIQDVQ